MGSIVDTGVCPVCGEEYLYDLDLRTLEYTKLSACACDRFKHHVEDFLKKRGLWEEFLRYHEELEAQFKEENENYD